MSETPKPEEGDVEKEAPKKGWLSRWRSKGDSPSGTPEPEPASGTPELEATTEVLEPEGGGAKPEGETETEAEKQGWLAEKARLISALGHRFLDGCSKEQSRT